MHRLGIKINALGGLVKFASPSTYAKLEVAFLLALRDKTLHVLLLCYTMLNCLPLLGPKQSDNCPHLMNSNISIVSEILDNSDRSDNTQLYKVATIRDLIQSLANLSTVEIQWSPRAESCVLCKFTIKYKTEKNLESETNYTVKKCLAALIHQTGVK